MRPSGVFAAVLVVMGLASVGQAVAQDPERVVEHTGPAATPGAAGATGGINTTVSGVGIGAGGSPTIADIHGPNSGIPSRLGAGTVPNPTGASGANIAPNSTGAVANRYGTAGTGAAGADPRYQSSP